MNLLDTIAAIFAPHECLGCGAEGALLCTNCTPLLKPIPERCYRCRKVSPEWQTCATCRKTSRLAYVRPATIYEHVAKAFIWKLKLAGVQAAAREMAQHMIGKVDRSPVLEVVIVPVPTATSRARTRGYDQAKLLAREFAQLTRLPYQDCLRRSGQLKQHGSSRQARLHQLEGAFRVRRTRKLQGKTVILIDDVITTGSTLEIAAKTLRAAGAKQVAAYVFAQP